MHPVRAITSTDPGRLLAALLLAAALPAGEALVVTLRPAVSLAAPRAVLSDVADLAGDADRVAAAGARPLVELPSLAPVTVDARLVRAALGPAEGPSAVVAGACILRRSARTFPAADLAAAAQTVAASAGGVVASTVLRPGSAIEIPAGGAETSILAEPLDRRQLGETAYRVRVMAGERELGRTLVVLDVRRWRDALVASQPLTRGTILSASDVRHERLAVTRSSPDPLDDPALVVGMRLRRDLDPGLPILAGDLGTVAAVASGSQVELQWVGERVVLSSSGIAMSEGKVGDVIQVRRSGDGKTIHGEIVAPGRVRITAVQ
jgi:flagella basal body P-ring formation protein FlgA